MRHIDVTHCDLTKLIAKAYDLSHAIGMGFLHFKPGPLPDRVAKQILNTGCATYPVSMDYVIGRAVKLSVRRSGNRLEITAPWYDHSESQLKELCDHIGACYVPPEGCL